MFRTVARLTIRQQTMRQQTRSMASEAGPIYKAVMSNNAKYVLFIIVGATVGEKVYCSFFNQMWHLNNQNKLYENIDWSKFNSNYKPETADE